MYKNVYYRLSSNLKSAGAFSCINISCTQNNSNKECLDEDERLEFGDRKPQFCVHIFYSRSDPELIDG